jgi:hypothetical protein
MISRSLRLMLLIGLVIAALGGAAGGAALAVLALGSPANTYQPVPCGPGDCPP